MKQRNTHRGFTIIELLVVVSIIALLVGILLPAVGRAREQAHLAASQSNLRQMMTAMNIYAAEWNDRHFTLCDDNLASYGGNLASALGSYLNDNGTSHPPVALGWGTGQGSGSGNLGLIFYPPNSGLVMPMAFNSSSPVGVGYGWFRMPNVQAFANYLNGRFYDPVFYAPKDRVVLDTIETCLDDPDDFCWPTDDPQGTNIYFSSYCFSPAALYSPEVLSKNPDTGEYWTDPWELPGAFRTPSMGQAKYADLKTHMLEHHWLQNSRAACNPFFQGFGQYDGCEPYFFNHALNSVPATLFYDGHIEMYGVQDAMAANSRYYAQTSEEIGLWTNQTDMGGNYVHLDWTEGGDIEVGNGGYFMQWSYEPHAATSYHILTTNGILGRDKSGE